MNNCTYKSAEIALCKLYRVQEQNQKIMLDYSNKGDSLKMRLKNLRRQYFPFDMEEMCKKNGM